MKRIKLLTFVFMLCIVAIAGRLFYVSAIDGKRLAEMAVAQRTEKIKFKSPRGVIYDRNMIRLTDSEMELVIKDGKPYYVDKRANGLLSHVIGYVSEDGGGCGIEGAFDYVLSSKGSSSLSYLKDINNNRVSEGYSVDISSKYSGICLTVDYHIQKITEEAMDKYGISGAAVVADCKSGEVVAMASRPDFDRQRLGEYLGGTDGELTNKAIVQYNPGSVFKIVVAAAALENSFSEDVVYECLGRCDIDGREFVCHKEDGHGRLTFEDAFANSCNIVFYQSGISLGAEEICKYATAFGIGREVFNINGIAESRGFVPHSSKSKGETANISIGQGEVMVTPLQVADILCTICNGGTRKQLTIIKGMVDDNGVCSNVGNADIGKVLSDATARRLMDMMRSTVEWGTGKGAQIAGFGAGGKTGSAETGWIKNGELMQQGWFAGFFPEHNPKYVCVIIAENGKSGNDSACPVFKEIGEQICDSKL